MRVTFLTQCSAYDNACTKSSRTLVVQPQKRGGGCRDFCILVLISHNTAQWISLIISATNSRVESLGVTMKDVPIEVSEWADEAKKALGIAWMLLKGEQPNPNAEQKSYLFKYGAALCSLNRGIKDKEKQKSLYQFSAKRVVAGFEESESAKAHYELNFLIAYIDAHVGLGLLNDAKAEEIMLYITTHFDINDLT